VKGSGVGWGSLRPVPFDGQTSAQKALTCPPTGSEHVGNRGKKRLISRENPCKRWCGRYNWMCTDGPFLL